MRHLSPSGLALTVLLIAVAGCSAPEPPPPSEPTFTEMNKVALMEQHYVAAITAHDMLIRNDLPSFRKHLAELATQSLPDHAPATWAAGHEKMQTAAARAADAKTLAASGAVMGSIVEACGSCHEALGQGPVYREPAPPTSDDPLKERMLAHQWATERLWEGVTDPWDDAWRRGAQAVAKSAVFPPDAPPAQLEQEKALRAAGDDAMLATTLSARAQSYGRVLATCAGCHGQGSSTD